MKTVLAKVIVLLFVTVGFGSTADAAGLAAGDSAERVTSVLGEPQGYMRIAGLEVFLYDRGRVEARDGVVTAVDLLSPAEAAALRLERERLQALREIAREERILEGRRLKTERLTDPAFAAWPLADRLAFWQSFRHRYPGAGGDEEYARLFQEQQREREAQRVRQQLADLERRTWAAEERAQRAERRAAEAQRRSAVWVQPVVIPAVHPVVYSSYRGYYRDTPFAYRHGRPQSRRGTTVGVGYHSHPHPRWHWRATQPSTFSISYRRSR